MNLALAAFTAALNDSGSPAYWTRSAPLAAWTGDFGVELPEGLVRLDFALSVTTAAITFTRNVAIINFVWPRGEAVDYESPNLIPVA